MTITVGELIEKLKGYDRSLLVSTEGCDCCGLASGELKEYTNFDKEKCLDICRAK
jgi:hypothetical protein